jgi:hypothetical protein
MPRCVIAIGGKRFGSVADPREIRAGPARSHCNEAIL